MLKEFKQTAVGLLSRSAALYVESFFVHPPKVTDLTKPSEKWENFEKAVYELALDRCTRKLKRTPTSNLEDVFNMQAQLFYGRIKHINKTNPHPLPTIEALSAAARLKKAAKDHGFDMFFSFLKGYEYKRAKYDPDTINIKFRREILQPTPV